MNTSGIYAILNITNEKIYVGSAKSFKSRWLIHLRELKKNKHYNSYLQRAWNKYGINNFIFVILEVTDNLLEREQHWINKLKPFDKNFGYNVCITAGSQLGLKHTEITKLKMSNAHKGKIKSIEWQEKITKALKGKRLSEETKRKFSLARLGRKATEEERAIMKLAQQNRKITPEAYERMTKANVGKKFSEDHKRKISEAHKGKPKSKEHKLNLKLAALRRWNNSATI